MRGRGRRRGGGGGERGGGLSGRVVGLGWVGMEEEVEWRGMGCWVAGFFLWWEEICLGGGGGVFCFERVGLGLDGA